MMNVKTAPLNELHMIREDKDSSLVSRHSSLDLSSRWILSRLAITADEMNRALEEYRFNDAAGSIYQFIWHEFCDWYIEMAKIHPEFNSGQDRKLESGSKWCLLYTLDASLRLLHPFMPFVTEEIWQKRMHVRNDPPEVAKFKESIMVSDYPKSLQRDHKAEEEMSYIIEAVMGIRTIRGELNISPSLKLNASIKTFSQIGEKILRENMHYIRSLAKAEEIQIGMNIGKPEGSATSVKSSMEIYVPLKGVLNIAVEVERLTKDKAKLNESIASLNNKLLNEDFLQRAPREIVQKEKVKYEELIHMKERIVKSIKMLKEVEVKRNA
jgi:valyl-tRNA synthetase